MNRTTIMLPETLKAKVVHLANLEGVSLGHVVREALEMRLQLVTKKRDSFYAEDALFTGKTPPNLAENHDDYLY